MSENAVEAIKLMSSCCIEAEMMMDFRIDHFRDESIEELCEVTYNDETQEQEVTCH